MEKHVPSTSTISLEEAFEIARITDDHWEKFVLEKLKLDAVKVKRIESKYRPGKRFDVIREWKEETGIKDKDVSTHIQTLIQEYLVEESTPAVSSLSQPDSDLCVMPDDMYPKKQGKGCALIIANSFSWDENLTLAAKKDIDLMEDLWHKTLDCDLFKKEVHINKTAGQMKLLLKEMTSLEQEYDYVVVVISTHGGVYSEKVVSEHEVKEDVELIKGEPSHGAWEESKGKIAQFKKNKEAFNSSVKNAKNEIFTVEVFFGDDFKPVREREIKKYFYNDQTTTFHGIPKFFILDYCRGSNVFDGVVSKACTEEAPEDVTCLMPAVSDVLVAYATHPSFVAHGQEKGSWLISAIADVFKKNYRKRDVVKMLTMVNERMKTTVGYEWSKLLQRHETRTAMSVFETSLTKDFYLK